MQLGSLVIGSQDVPADSAVAINCDVDHAISPFLRSFASARCLNIPVRRLIM